MKYLRFLKVFIFVMALFTILGKKSVFADWVAAANNQYQYVNPSTGQNVVNNWIQTNNGYYFMNAEGYMTIGWLMINGKWYYFGENGIMQLGMKEINGKRYYLHPQEGYMITGWVQENNMNVIDYHYFNPTTGEEVEGWFKIDEKWYYFLDYNCLVNVWAQINNFWYHFGRDGSMTTGWYEQDGRYYFLNMATGSMVTGWIQDEYGYRYYLSETNGTLSINTSVMINGYYYAFDSYGRLIQNEETGNASSYHNISGPSAIYGYPNNTQNISQFGTGNMAVGVSPIQGMNSASSQGATSTTNQRMFDNTPISPGSTKGPS